MEMLGSGWLNNYWTNAGVENLKYEAWVGLPTGLEKNVMSL